MTPPRPRDIACEELVEMVTDYLEGVLTPEETAAVEAHLALCEGCDIYLEQMRATIAALGSVPVQTLSDEALDALLAAFRSPQV